MEVNFYASTKKTTENFGWRNATSIEDGIKKVIDDKTTIFLPLEDNGTEEYENLKKWLAEGNTIS